MTQPSKAFYYSIRKNECVNEHRNSNFSNTRKSSLLSTPRLKLRKIKHAAEYGPGWDFGIAHVLFVILIHSFFQNLSKRIFTNIIVFYPIILANHLNTFFFFAFSPLLFECCIAWAHTFRQSFNMFTYFHGYSLSTRVTKLFSKV